MVEAPAVTEVTVPKGPVKKDAKAKSKEGKSTSAKSLAKAKAEPTAASAQRYNTQTELRSMLVGLDWTVHYATHNFGVDYLGKMLVEMDREEDTDRVKEALWSLVPEKVKEDLGKAREAKLLAEEKLATWKAKAEMTAKESLDVPDQPEDEDLEI